MGLMLTLTFGTCWIIIAEAFELVLVLMVAVSIVQLTVLIVFDHPRCLSRRASVADLGFGYIRG